MNQMFAQGPSALNFNQNVSNQQASMGTGDLAEFNLDFLNQVDGGSVAQNGSNTANMTQGQNGGNQFGMGLNMPDFGFGNESNQQQGAN